MAFSHVVVDDGTREVPILNKFGKEICKIYFRPTDYSIIDRYNKVMARLNGVLEPLSGIALERDGSAQNDSDWELLKSVEKRLKEEINFLFDMDEADAIFSTRDPFSSVHGEFFCTNVLNALGEFIKAAFEEEARLASERISEYTSDLPEESEVNEDAGATSDNA